MRRIKLTQNKIAMIDDEDFDLISQFKWHAVRAKHLYYASTGNKKDGTEFLMHRVILKPPKNKVIDHLNGRGLDNRRSNLRICTVAENNRNKSIHRAGKKLGTAIHRYGKKIKYQSKVIINGKFIYLGLFLTKKEAHQAYLSYFKSNP